uniref:Uncharacterized protein n=1 Tax=Rhizophora mucronata TaxID=61149 RepID=A0A2P2QUN8_RHIMU
MNFICYPYQAPLMYNRGLTFSTWATPWLL